MQLYQLEQFIVIAQCEHMTLAAEILHVSQPALSQSISRLEDELGVKLFDRNGRQIQLNMYGREFLIRVENLFRELEDGKKIINDMKAAGLSRIRVTDSTGSFFTRDIIRLYSEKYPETAIEYWNCRTKDIGQLLLTGDTDLVITTTKPSEKEFQCELLGEVELAVLVPENHTMKIADRMQLTQFSDSPFVSSLRDTEIRRFFENLCFETSFFPQFHFESTDLSLIDEFAKRNQAMICTMHGTSEKLISMHEEVSHARGFKRVTLEDTYIRPNLWLVTLKKHYLSDAALNFIELMKGLF